jgi:hypothetical protein
MAQDGATATRGDERLVGKDTPRARWGRHEGGTGSHSLQINMLEHSVGIAERLKGVAATHGAIHRASRQTLCDGFLPVPSTAVHLAWRIMLAISQGTYVPYIT